MAPPPQLKAGRRLRLLAVAALALLAAAAGPITPVAAQQKAVVVAFGDSVTKGFVPTSDANIPYTLTLEQLLRARFGGGGRVDNANSGAAALLPAPGKALMAPPIYAVLSTPQASQYDWAVFMLGTNDLLMGHRSAGEVVAAARPLIDAALAKGSKVMLLTMPPTAISTAAQERERQALNERYKALAREYRSRGKGVSTVDLDRGWLDRLGGGFAQSARVTLEDGVHLCRACYQRLGGIVFRAMGAVDGWCGGGGKKGAAVVSASDVGGLGC